MSDQLCARCGSWGHPTERHDNPRGAADEPEQVEWETWADIDLDAPLAGNGPEPPSVGSVPGATPLFYAGKVNDLHGEPETGKGWVALVAAAEAISVGQHVMYDDFEDNPATIVDRLRLLGLTVEQIRTYLHYKRPEQAIGERLPLLVGQARGCGLVIIDGLNEAYSLHGLNPDKAIDVALFGANLAVPLAHAGPAVILIDHVVKNRQERGRWQGGSGHKLATVDGASFMVEIVKPFAIGHSGSAKLVVAKDRNGHHRRGDTAALLRVDAEPDGGVRVELRNDDSHTASGAFRPTVIMGRCWRAVRDWHDDVSPSGRQLRAVVKGDKATIPQALACLVDEGCLVAARDGNATRYTLGEKAWTEPE